MIKALKEIKRQQDAIRKNKKHVRDSENRVIINMVVRDDSEFLSAFSETENAVISSEVASFLDDRTLAMTPNEQLSLHVHSNCIQEDEKPVYNKAISEYYSERYAANERELIRNAIISIILGVAGIIILALMIGLDRFIGDKVWGEVIDIAAWVFIWEAVDLWFIENHVLRIKQRRYLSLISMKVSYFPLQTKQVSAEQAEEQTQTITEDINQ